MEKEMEKEKNFMRMEIYYLKVNIKMGKDGKEKDMIQMKILNTK